MTKAFEAFRVWVTVSMALNLFEVLSCSRSAALALRGFGLHLYEAGLPRRPLVYAITAVQDSHPHLRHQLTPAWQIDKKWQQAEPGECRPVISKPVLLAAVSVAILWLWNWRDWAAITHIGFLCMLRPFEFIALTRADLILSSDALSSDRVAYVYIRNSQSQNGSFCPPSALPPGGQSHFVLP